VNRRRLIAAAPIRSAFDAWSVLTKLLADTLEQNDAIPAGSVSKELGPLNGLGPALVAGGHLESKGLVLVDEGMHVTILFKTADAALDVEENLAAIPGGASATANWILYLPPAGPLESAVRAATKKSSHLSVESPPPSPRGESDQRRGDTELDLAALRRMSEP
jgi:hypothetical protein